MYALLIPERQLHDRECLRGASTCTYPRAHDILYDVRTTNAVVVQLPSVFQYRCAPIPLHPIATPVHDRVICELCPDTNILTSLYEHVYRQTRLYQGMTVRWISQMDQATASTTLYCPQSDGTAASTSLLYKANAVCTPRMRGVHPKHNTRFTVHSATTNASSNYLLHIYKSICRSGSTVNVMSCMIVTYVRMYVVRDGIWCTNMTIQTRHGHVQRIYTRQLQRWRFYQIITNRNAYNASTVDIYYPVMSDWNLMPRSIRINVTDVMFTLHPQIVYNAYNILAITQISATAPMHFTCRLWTHYNVSLRILTHAPVVSFRTNRHSA